MLQKILDGCGYQMRHVVASNGSVFFGNRDVPAIVLLGGFILVLSAADVYGASTTITLDSLPDAVYAGSQVIFTGTLTSGGSPLSGGTVIICEDDPFVPDECLVSGVTDRSGKYFIAWTAEAAIIEMDFDIYAEFKSAGGYSSSQTYRQTMSVLKYGGSLTLDDIPTRAAYGDVVTFSGVLSLDGHSPEGSVIYIKDEDTLNPDDLLVSAYVDASGRFATSWIVADVDPDYTIDIQAVYEANFLYYRMATPIQKLRAYDGPPASQQPDPSPTTGDGYMKLYHALDFEQPPRIAIVPAPDSYAEVSKHIVPVQEGILQFTAMMEQAYGTGDWSVEFEVVEPGGRFSTKPDIKLDLVTREEDAGCGVDYAGWARIVTTKPVPTVVCSLERPSDERIRSTAAHEFVHAIGIGHTFNIQGDMLCSVENGIPTCPDVYNKSTTPSVLNLAAVAAVYGTDGFQNPNNDITSEERFALNGYQNGDTIVSQPSQDVADEYQIGTIFTDLDQYKEGEVILVDGVYLGDREELLSLYIYLTDQNGDVEDVMLVSPEVVIEEFFFGVYPAGTYTVWLYDEYDWVEGNSFEISGVDDAVIYADEIWYSPGDTVYLDGFYWGSYDGWSELFVLDPFGNTVEQVDVRVVDDFFGVYVDAYHTYGRYLVLLYDDSDNLAASTAFHVSPEP